MSARAEQKGNPGQLSSKDYHFATEAAQANADEVKLGQLAQQKGTDPAVKQFGQHMVQDHSKANDELTQLAQRKGIELPKELDANHQAVVRDSIRSAGSQSASAQPHRLDGMGATAWLTGIGSPAIHRLPVPLVKLLHAVFHG